MILDAAESAVTGRRATTCTPHVGTPAIPVAQLPTGDLTEDGPAYEVMYLLDADDDAIPALRARLAPLGDSLVVVGGEGLWNVHVHVDDVGAAVEAGIRAGRPAPDPGHPLRRAGRPRAREQRAERRGRALVVAVAAGPGLAELFGEAGRRGDRGRSRAAGRAPARSSRRSRRPVPHEVVVLPNDPDSIGVAEAAAHEAEEQGIHVVVDPDPRPGAGHRRARGARAGPPPRQRRRADDLGRPRRPARRGHGRRQATP